MPISQLIPDTAETAAPAMTVSCWFTENVQPHEPALRGYLQHRFPSIDADDVLQESYLKLLRIRAVGKIASVKAYAFSVARRTALKVFRRRQKFYSDVPVNELPDWQILDGGADAAEAANVQHRIQLVADALESLPERCRELVRLVIVEGLTSAEIAGRLALAESTVRVQLARGARKCADYLRERGEVE